MVLTMPYKTVIKISPEVDEWLKSLKKEWKLQSHNKVLRRIKDEHDA